MAIFSPDRLKLFDQSAQHFEIGRLREVVVEAGVVRATAVVVLPVAGQRHEQHHPAKTLLPNRAGHFIAVHSRQADVEQDDFRMLLDGKFERLRAAMSHENLISVES